MKIGAFSDIHGNLTALEKMLDQTKKQNLDRYIFCGDIFGYFSHQKEVIHRLKNLSNLYSVKGNHDVNYLLSLKDMDKRKMLEQKYGVSYSIELIKDERDFIDASPDILELDCNGVRVGVVHGSLEDHFNGRLYPDSIMKDEKLYSEYDVVILGHTHYQMSKVCGNTMIINPGSLGQPRDHKGYSYCIFDTETVNCSFHTVRIDSKALFADLMDYENSRSVLEYLQRKMRVDI